MRFFDRRRSLALVSAAGMIVAACSGAAAPSAAPASAAPASAAPASAAPASAAPASAAPASAAPASAATGAQLYSTNLKGICPDPVVIQTNWYPEVDHAFTYQLIGPGGKIDTQKLTYTGPLEKTGVQLEIRAGGPAIGFQQVSSILYQDDSILLGYVWTDEAIQDSKAQPTIEVFSSYEKNPQIWMWGNPAWNFTSTADIAKAGAKVLAFDGATYLDVFTQDRKSTRL